MSEGSNIHGLVCPRRSDLRVCTGDKVFGMVHLKFSENYAKTIDAISQPDEVRRRVLNRLEGHP